MTTRGRRAHCSVDAHYGHLRLRWRFRGKRDGRVVPKWMSDDETHWIQARELAKRIDAIVARGDDPLERVWQERSRATSARLDPGLTVAEFYERWFEDVRVLPGTRKAQRRDYQRHIKRYVLPHIGHIPLTQLQSADMVALQTILLQQPISKHGLRRLQMHVREKAAREAVQPARRMHASNQGPRKLSEKYVKNILVGSLRAMLRDADERYDLPVEADRIFKGLRWDGHGEIPKPDPFEPEERERILGWFRTKKFGLGGAVGPKNQPRIHLPYYAYLHALLWSGMRPSEAAGLQWQDVDLARGEARIERSYHSYTLNKGPKTERARRTVELMPETVEVLRQIMPLRVEPDTPVFTNVDGAPIEPKVFAAHWYRCLRALGLRVRGLYATKDTYVSLCMTRNVNPTWLEEQTGVAWATLRRHYGTYLPKERKSELDRLREPRGLRGRRSPSASR
jgi:integrase